MEHFFEQMMFLQEMDGCGSSACTNGCQGCTGTCSGECTGGSCYRNMFM